MSKFVNAEEEEHWQDVKRTMLKYSDFVNYDLETRQDHLNRLSAKNVARLPDATFEKLGAIAHAARNNQDLLDCMVKFHSQDEDEDGMIKNNIPDKNKGKSINSNQQHRNNAILHSVYREWSEEGKEERASSFDLLLNELLDRLPVTSINAYKYRVLTPGCGLGRLPLEVAAKGYKCQGNEFSAFMAIASHYMLNGCSDSKYFDLHPWLEKVCNVVNIKDTLQCCQIPDKSAMEILDENGFFSQPDGIDNNDNNNNNSCSNSHDHSQNHQHNNSIDLPRFSMSAGDFVELYSASDQHEQWDAVLTCFFVDTAPMVIDYVDIIYNLLPPGGFWINTGPLLYHWVADVEGNNDDRYNQSIELSWEELKHVMIGTGFEFLKETWQECKYAHCTTSMMYTVYNTVLFTVQKPLDKSRLGN